MRRFWGNGATGSTRNLPLSPRQQLHWQNLSDVIILELCSLLKACYLQGKACTLKCDKFHSSSALLSYLFPTPQPNTMHMFLRQLMDSLQGQSRNKDPALPISGVCVLIPDCCFSSLKCRHKRNSEAN